MAGERIERAVVVRTEAARADDHADAALERRPDVALDRRGVRVVDEHVGLERLERFGNGREVVGVGARDAGDQLEVVRCADRLGHGCARPAGDTGDADADHVTAACDFTWSM